MEDVTIVGPHDLEGELATLRGSGPARETIQQWLAAPYRPLPSLVQAARHIFDHEPLPEIRRAQSTGIPQALATVHAIAQRARRDGEHHLVLLSGAPGAGKTLVGLQLVHEQANLATGESPAIFLSGNAPLVEVLQYALRNKVFVQDVHKFMYDQGVKSTLPASEDVLVFDEAQRAWDRDRVEEWYLKNRGIRHPYSEPETFVNIASRRKTGGVLVGLVGYGQEIHTGEEGGVGQWGEAITRAGVKWTIHCAPRWTPHFPGARIEEHSSLDLVVPIRAHAASEAHLWVEHVLEGRLEEARAAAKRLRDTQYYLYLTDDLHAARSFMHARYEAEPAKTFGIVASSKASDLPAHGLENDFTSTRRVRIGPWFYGRDGQPPRCRAMDQVVTEFQCQGLELDGVILGWGNDFQWNGRQWEMHARHRARDPERLRKNSYRVLLTRARDGIVIFCPRQHALTFDALTQAGCAPLPRDA